MAYGILLSQFSSVAQLCPTLCDPMDCSTPGFPVHHQLPELAQTQVHRVSDTIQPSHPLSSPFPPAFHLSQHQGLSNESVLRVTWPKYWSFSFSISPANEYSELISFRIDWFDLLAVQRTLKSLLQHHSSKSSILRQWAFFIVQLSHPYMTTGKTTSPTRNQTLTLGRENRESYPLDCQGIPLSRWKMLMTKYKGWNLVLSCNQRLPLFHRNCLWT